LTAYVVTV